MAIPKLINHIIVIVGNYYLLNIETYNMLYIVFH